MSSSSQFFPIALSLIAAALGAWAQYFYKIAAGKLGVVSIIKNYHLMAGLACFTGVLVLLIIAFRFGGKMFVVYPVYATTYIWGGLISYYLLKEAINTWQILGVVLIMVGVAVVSLGHSTN